MTTLPLDLTEVWSRTMRHLDSSELTADKRAFLGLTVPMGVIGNTFLIAAPNEFTRDILETRLRPAMTKALSSATGQDMQFAVTVDSKAAGTIPSETEDKIADATYAPVSPPPPTGGSNDETNVVDLTQPLRNPVIDLTQRPGSGARQTNADEDRGLNPRYNFDTFVAGASNRFAHAAAVAVAEQPAKAYNPMFIYGDSGLGKTHLLHAIGHYARQLYSGIKVRYVIAEDFTNDFINSIRDDRAADFQRRFREIDILLIDDIQFLSGKQQTQEAFFHTFNALHNANKQIVLTSDMPPRKLDGFEERLRSRFEWGLTTDIQPPELETRMAILSKKCAQDKLTVPDAVLEFIASKISSNIRELEGALIRVNAYANINRAALDIHVAADVLRNVIPDDSGPEIQATTIMMETAKFYALSLEDLRGASRSRTLVNARQVAMYLCREMTDLSLPKIGSLFGGRDHTTVMHADRKIRQSMSEKAIIYKQVTDLTAKIRVAARNA